MRRCKKTRKLTQYHTYLLAIIYSSKHTTYSGANICLAASGKIWARFLSGIVEMMTRFFSKEADLSKRQLQRTGPVRETENNLSLGIWFSSVFKKLLLWTLISMAMLARDNWNCKYKIPDIRKTSTQASLINTQPFIFEASAQKILKTLL